MFIANTKGGIPKLIEYTIYGFLALFPFIIFKTFLYQGSSSRFLALTIVSAILAISFGIYLLNKKNKVTFYKSPILVALGVYLIYLFVSAFLGADFATSFWSKIERTSALFYLVHLVPFLLFLVHLFSQKDSREIIFKIILTTSGIYSLASSLGPQGFNVIFKSVPYDGFWFGNSTFAAMYLLGAFLLSIYYVSRKPANEIKWYQWLIPVVIFFNPFLINIKIFSGGFSNFGSIFGIAMASSILAFVSLGMLLAIFLISRIRNIKYRNIIGILATVFSVIILALSIQSLLSSDGVIRKLYEKSSTLARPVVWDISKEAIKDKPATGWGIDNFNLAFQDNFDNRLLEEKYGNEAWFDRAHNVILDQTVDTGYMGVSLYIIVYLIIMGCLLYALLKAKERDDVVLGSVLITYFFAHLLELQTAFDTTVSYIMLVIMTALSVYLFNKIQQVENKKTEFSLNSIGRNIVGISFIIFFSWALFFGSFSFWKTQSINNQIRIVGSAEKRIPLYEDLFKTKIDLAGIIWRFANDFQKGISVKPEVIEDPAKAEKILEELEVLTKEYEDYLAKDPNNFRIRLNLADLYIYHSLLGVDIFNKPNNKKKRALTIVPNHPQPYVMKSVTHVYRNDFKNALMYVQKAEEINPNAVQVINMKKYVSESQKTFPEIDLYFFSQI